MPRHRRTRAERTPAHRALKAELYETAVCIDDATARWEAGEITLPELIEQAVAAADTLNRLALGSGAESGGVAEGRPVYRRGPATRDLPVVAQRWRTFAAQLPHLANGLEHGGVEAAMSQAAFRAFVAREAQLV